MGTSVNPIKKALISVFNKEGLEPLCHTLRRMGVQVYSTGGTASYLKEQHGIDVISIESVTQFPEMMDGRVKTLHPKVFGGILARRNQPSDLQEAMEHEIPLFDLVVVNLYPFWDHLKGTKEEQAKFIDIGGPSMLRAAAKNSLSLTVLSEPTDYADFIQEIELFGGTSQDFRYKMAARTFQRTSNYDAMIAQAWTSDTELPAAISLGKLTALRYGENPHQKGAWGSTLQTWKCLQGKELSYNNLLDAEAATRLNGEFNEPAITIVKHNNPCGVASGKWPLGQVFEKALACDSKSAFGGIVAVNREVDADAAQSMAKLFLELVIAPKFSSQALEIFSQKKNLRLIEWPEIVPSPIEVRASLGGWLIQEGDPKGLPATLQIVTKAKIASDAVWNDLKFAWLVCKHVRSNAIVIAKGGISLGIGAGQMSRVDAVQIALQKAKAQDSGSAGSVLASDAFFPFRDNIDLLKDSGIQAIIQPGGSQRDAEVVAACDELGIAMVYTGKRHFRH